MKTLAILAITVIISACSNSDNNNNSPIVGKWLTEACEQAPLEMGPYEGEWGKGIYEFTQENTIKTSVQLYFGSTCTVATTLIVPDNSGKYLSYTDSGSVLLKEGITGNKFTIIFTTSTPPATIDGFYNISNERLCFSDGFSFDPFYTRINGSATTTNNINFEKCLAIKQP